MHNWNWSLPLTDGLPACLPAKSIQQQRKKQDISRRRDRSVSSNFVQTKNSCQWSISKEFLQIISIIINPTFFLGGALLYRRSYHPVAALQFAQENKNIRCVSVKESTSLILILIISYKKPKKNHKNLHMCLLPILLCFPSFSFLCNKFYCIQTVV